MNPIEWVAAGLGLINVALVVRRSLWNYPFGIVMVALYFFIFAEARLYSDALLQIFFLVIQLYGWWNWRVSRADADEVVVEVLTPLARMGWLAGTAGFALVWGEGMARYTDAAAPYVDALVAGASVAAQILQSQRKLECWVLWVAVDVIAVGLYWSRGLGLTAALYAVFLGMAAYGGWAWWQQLQRRPVRA